MAKTLNKQPKATKATKAHSHKAHKRPTQTKSLKATHAKSPKSAKGGKTKAVKAPKPTDAALNRIRKLINKEPRAQLATIQSILASLWEDIDTWEGLRYRLNNYVAISEKNFHRALKVAQREKMRAPTLAMVARVKAALRPSRKSREDRSEKLSGAHGLVVSALAYLYGRLGLWETWERKCEQACEGHVVEVDNRRRRVDCDNCWDSDCDGCESESDTDHTTDMEDSDSNSDTSDTSDSEGSETESDSDDDQ